MKPQDIMEAYKKALQADDIEAMKRLMQRRFDLIYPACLIFFIAGFLTSFVLFTLITP